MWGYTDQVVPVLLSWVELAWLGLVGFRLVDLIVAN